MKPIQDHIHDLHHSEYDTRKLRDYQLQAKMDIYEAWNKVNNVMFQMPTGTGKTVMFSAIINELDMWVRTRGDRPIRILIIAHREELIDQIADHLKRRFIHFGIIKGGVKPNYSEAIQIGSVQTVTHRARKETMLKLDFDYIIIDEAHHSVADSYKKLWQYFPNSKKLGVTATPSRIDRRGFTDLYDTLIVTPSVKSFIEKGWLSPYTYYSINDTSDIFRGLDYLKVKAGDYDLDELQQFIDTGRIRAQLYNSYETFVKGKKGIIYAINVAHAEHICKEYSGHGVKIVKIDSKTPAQERRDLIRKFKDGQIEVIVNVNIFSEGFDCPDIEFIQLARPTKSLIMYLQQVGRGLRITEEKTHCIILDNVGMYLKFGLPDANRKWINHFIGKHLEDQQQPQFGSCLLIEAHHERNISEGSEELVEIQGSEFTDVIEEVVTTPVDKAIKLEKDSPVHSEMLLLIPECTTDTAFSKLDKIFSNVTTSYKYFWMMALIDVATNQNENNLVHYDRLIKLMISHAWPLVKRYKLSLGTVDKLSGIIKSLNSYLHLSEWDSIDSIFWALDRNNGYPVHVKDLLEKNVPYRFLSPWIPYKSDKQVIEESSKTQYSPYKITIKQSCHFVEFNEGWKEFLSHYAPILREYVFTELSIYLAKYNNRSQEELKQMIDSCCMFRF